MKLPPHLESAINHEHSQQEAECGHVIYRNEVVRGLLWGGILREAERRVAEKEEQIAAMAAPTYEERCAAFVAGLRALTRQTGVTLGVAQQYDDGAAAIRLDEASVAGEYREFGEADFSGDPTKKDAHYLEWITPSAKPSGAT